MSNRRTFIQKAFGLGARLSATPKLFADSQDRPSSRSRSASSGPAFNTPVVTTDIGDMPYTMDGDAKIFHLVAEVVKQKTSPLKTIDVWGFNGSARDRRFRSIRAIACVSSSTIACPNQGRCIGTDLRTPFKTTACPASVRTR